MVSDVAAIDRVFGALADATRRDILARVLSREASLTTLARQYAMSFAAVQKHVAVLERAHLVTKQRHGREQLVRGDADALAVAAGVLAQYEELWRARLHRLDQLLHDSPTDAPTAGPTRGGRA